MSLGRRLAKLEQRHGGDGGAGVIGIGRVNHASGTAPDVVTVAGSGETMTEAAFRVGYPLGLLVVRTEYGPPSGPVRAGDGTGEGECPTRAGRPPSGV